MLCCDSFGLPSRDVLGLSPARHSVRFSPVWLRYFRDRDRRSKAGNDLRALITARLIPATSTWYAVGLTHPMCRLGLMGDPGSLARSKGEFGGRSSSRESDPVPALV